MNLYKKMYENMSSVKLLQVNWSHENGTKQVVNIKEVLLTIESSSRI